MHHAEDAQRHTASDAEYTSIVDKLDRFALQFQDSTSVPASKGEALGQFETIMKDYTTARRNRLTTPEKIYDDADIQLEKRWPTGDAA
jgi:hypothetical protein